MSVDLLPLRESWEAYRASLSREVRARAQLRAAIREALRAGASQAEIARALGVSRQHIHRLLRGGAGR